MLVLDRYRGRIICLGKQGSRIVLKYVGVSQARNAAAHRANVTLLRYQKPLGGAPMAMLAICACDSQTIAESTRSEGKSQSHLHRSGGRNRRYLTKKSSIRNVC